MRRYSSDIFKPKFYPKPDFTRVDFTELPPPEPMPDYWNKSFAHYPWPKDPYKNNQPFFTKDSIDSFVKLKDLSNHLPNDVDENSIGLPQRRNNSVTGRQLINQIIKENEEFYASLMEEAKQNVTYQDGTEEINEAFRDTIPALEIDGAIDDVKDTEPEEINQAIENVKQDCTVVQNQDLPQPEINNQANPVSEEMPAPDQLCDSLEDYTSQYPATALEPQPEMAQDQMMPLADEVMEGNVIQSQPQNLEQIVEEQQGMMGEPPGIFAPEHFGLI